MNIKTLIASIVTSILVVAGGFVVYHPVSTNTNTITQVKGAPDFGNSPYLNVNGVSEWYYNVPFKTGTTTLCSIATPASSTAISFSIQYVSFRFSSATSTAQKIDVGTSTSITGSSTNTLISSYVVAANATTTGNAFIASTANNSVFSAGQNINFVTDLPVSSVANGICQVEMTQF